MKLKKEQQRVLTVVYELSKGVPGVRLNVDEIEKRCDELNIFNISDEEYERYRRGVVERFRGGLA